jgi:hypothetical protein
MNDSESAGRPCVGTKCRKPRTVVAESRATTTRPSRPSASIAMANDPVTEECATVAREHVLQVAA